jgi:hypothetical protein
MKNGSKQVKLGDILKLEYGKPLPGSKRTNTESIRSMEPTEKKDAPMNTT